MEQADQILAFLKQGDKRGLELLFRQFYRPLVMYACKFIDSREEAEDIVQEVFIKFWEKSRFDFVERYLRSYLYHSVHNRCLDALEKKTVVKLESTDSLLEFSDTEMPDDSEWNARVDEIYREIDSLPARTREIFVAIVLDGKRYRDVADELDISINTVKTAFSRALSTLRGNLCDRSFVLLFPFL